MKETESQGFISHLLSELDDLHAVHAGVVADSDDVTLRHRLEDHQVVHHLEILHHLHNF